MTCLVVGSLLASPARGAESCEFELQPGEVVREDYSGFHGYVAILVPDQPAPESGFPVIFYYHGWSTGLKPNVRIMSAVTDNRDFILVGMSYRTKRFYEELDRKSLRRELGHLDSVLDKLAACAPVNRDVLFLAGYSQGGYAVSMLGEQRIEGFAGIVLLGSGRRLAKMYLPENGELEGWPVFVGAGDRDERHYPIANNSAQLYALLGARVSMETWPGVDHIQGWSWYQGDPDRGAGLKAWLDEVARQRSGSGNPDSSAQDQG
ncbi:MAG: hypothetical protein R3348_05590 [Xanthomonadales bacterium]|nr:hypothetical protein [Xanthomonadales bacterium]